MTSFFDLLTGADAQDVLDLGNQIVGGAVSGAQNSVSEAAFGFRDVVSTLSDAFVSATANLGIVFSRLGEQWLDLLEFSFLVFSILMLNALLLYGDQIISAAKDIAQTVIQALSNLNPLQ